MPLDLKLFPCKQIRLAFYKIMIHEGGYGKY